MDNLAFVIITFIVLFMLVLRQKMKTDIKRESFLAEKGIIKERQLMKNNRAKIKDTVHIHEAK